MTVQKFRVATNKSEAENIPKEFPCDEYVIKAQVLAGGRGKGHFDNGFKVKCVLDRVCLHCFGRGIFVAILISLKSEFGGGWIE